MPTSRTIRFGLYEANLDSGELRREGVKIRLQSQPFQLLTLLQMRYGEVVTREEIRQKLWPADTFVDFMPSMSWKGLTPSMTWTSTGGFASIRPEFDPIRSEPRYRENCPRSAGEIAVLTLAVTRPFCLGSRPRRLEHLKRSCEHRSNGEKSRRGQRDACAKAVLPRADNCRSMILVKSASDCAPLKNSPLIKKVGVAFTPAWEPASKSC